MGVLPTFFVYGALGGQEIVLDALELELEVAVNQHVGVVLGTETGSSTRGAASTLTLHS